jgi:hypothetical protein
MCMNAPDTGLTLLLSGLLEISEILSAGGVYYTRVVHNMNSEFGSVGWIRADSLSQISSAVWVIP